jgi:excinuclease ABC subunit A
MELPEATRLLIGFDMPVVTAPAIAPQPEPEDEEATVAEEGHDDSSQPNLPDLVDPVAEMIAALRRKGFGRLDLDGRTISLEDVDAASLKDRATLQVIVDRVKIEGELRARLTDSIETAYTEGGGAAFAIQILPQGSDADAVTLRFSERFECV